MSKHRDTKVKVAVRLKPEAHNHRRCASESTNLPGKVVQVGEKTFEYDQVYGEQSTQAEIYENSVRGLVQGCFKGYNGTVLAYGQTGSGKTFSTMGIPHDEEEEGIIPRAVRQIFGFLKDPRGSSEEGIATLFQLASVHVSFIEIYNEECRDLLHPDIPSRDIMIREDKDGKIFFTGARDEIVPDAQAAISFLEMGNVQRTTAGTSMNASSSRSHAIFTVSLELFAYPDPDKEQGGGGGDGGKAGSSSSASSSKQQHNSGSGNGHYIQSKLHLVDLAGSERAKRTHAEGKRFKESVGINQGLLALSKVIRALTANTGSNGGGGSSNSSSNTGGRAGHVPYRESKLTRFLQDSLGGNSQTVMLACVSPHDSNAHETLGTLQYASRARSVQNRAVANVKITSLQQQEQQQDAAAAHSGAVASSMRDEVESSLVSALRHQLGRLQEEMHTLRINRVPRSSRGRRRGLGFADGGGGGGGGGGDDDDDGEVLRASVNSLYDSISAAHLVPGGSLVEGLGSDEEGETDSAGAVADSSAPVQASQSALVSLEEARQGLQEGLGRFEASRHYSDQWARDHDLWHLCSGARRVSEALEAASGPLRTILALAQASSKRGLKILNSSSSVDETEVEVARLRAELSEARDDLRQDEEVFRDKARELKRSRKDCKAIEAVRDALVEENEALKQQVAKLLASNNNDNNSMHVSVGAMHRLNSPARPSTAGSTVSEAVFTADDKVDRALERRREAKGRGGHKQQQYIGSGDDGDDDDLELSVAVLESEPHISSLMEDLEAVQLEKEKLMRQNREIERRYAEAAEQLAALESSHKEGEEKDDGNDSDGFGDGCRNGASNSNPGSPRVLSRRLRELEAGIKLKQQCINDLAAKEAAAVALSEEQVKHVRVLEERAAALQSQLDERRGTSVSEERLRRVQLETQLAEVMRSKQSLEKAYKRQKKAESAAREEAALGEKYLAELSSLRTEYARLSTEVENSEGRHRKHLDSLLAQVNSFKKVSAESRDKIKSLETRNKELTSRLQRSARQLRGDNRAGVSSNITTTNNSNYRNDHDHDDDDDRTVQTFASSATAHTQSSSRQGGGVEGRASKIAFSDDSTSTQQRQQLQQQQQQQQQQAPSKAELAESRRRADLHLQWLGVRVNELTSARLASHELLRLHSKISELEESHSEAVRLLFYCSSFLSLFCDVSVSLSLSLSLIHLLPPACIL
jgi:hypothetical protein